MHVLCIFSTNFTLGIITKDLHSIVRSRRPVVAPTECPNPKPWPPLPPPTESPRTATDRMPVQLLKKSMEIGSVGIKHMVLPRDFELSEVWKCL